ncbi:TPA: hypothetical protein ACGOZ1_001846 [Streptococcus suis]
MLEFSKNLRDFKKEVGQLNHFLITIEVALKNVNSNTVVPGYFNTTWNPQNWQQSVHRSEQWARKSALTYICSAVEAYFESIFQKPSIIQQESLIEDYSAKVRRRGISPTISWKMSKVNGCYQITQYEKDLVFIMIKWRNGLIHQLPDYSNFEDYQTIKNSLIDNKDMIYNNHCHLDIEELLSSFEKREVPTFKETASMIKATIDYVTQVDLAIVGNLDFADYIKNALSIHFKDLEQNNLIRYNKYFQFDEDRKVRYLQTVLVESFRLKKEIFMNDSIVKQVIQDIVKEGNIRGLEN